MSNGRLSGERGKYFLLGALALLVTFSAFSAVTAQNTAADAKLKVPGNGHFYDNNLTAVDHLNPTGGTTMVGGDLNLTGDSELHTSGVYTDFVSSTVYPGKHLPFNSNNDVLVRPDFDANNGGPYNWRFSGINGSLLADGNLDMANNNIENYFSGGCSDNQHITKINDDGSISCGSDSGDISDVNAGSHLTGGGSSGSVTLDVSDDWVDIDGDTMSGGLGMGGNSVSGNQGTLEFGHTDGVRLQTYAGDNVILESDVGGGAQIELQDTQLILDGHTDDTGNCNVDSSANINCDGSKNWIHDLDNGKTAYYTSQESPQVRAVIEGTANVSDGSVMVDLPYHFSQIVSDDRPDLTVQTTGHMPGDIWVPDRSESSITIK